MKAETYKAIKDKQKKHPIRDWWNKNGYKVLRIILFPIWLYTVIKEKLSNYRYDHTEWDEERTNEILNYYIPNFSKWNEEEKTLFFFDNGYGWYLCYAKRYLKRKDFYYWNKFASLKIRNYLIEKFELEGFEKQIIDSGCSFWTEIVFKQREEV